MAVYLLHFETKLAHAQHYIGYARERNIESRIQHHQNGSGARILQVCNERGIKYILARIWPGADKNFERRLKNCKKPSRFCPICHGEKAKQNMIPDNI